MKTGDAVILQPIGTADTAEAIIGGVSEDGYHIRVNIGKVPDWWRRLERQRGLFSTADALVFLFKNHKGHWTDSQTLVSYSITPKISWLKMLMSYEDTNCPCGGKKERDTVLCSECETEFADHPSMAAFKNLELPTEARRHAAIILVTLSRKRKRGTVKPLDHSGGRIGGGLAVRSDTGQAGSDNPNQL